MKLTIKDRIVINALYPQQTNLIEQILVRDIKNKVDIKQDELEKYKIIVQDGALTWQGKDEFDIDFTDKELELLKKQINILDKKNQITQDIVDLCLKIQGK